MSDTEERNVIMVTNSKKNDQYLNQVLVCNFFTEIY